MSQFPSLADELMNDLAGAPSPDASLADALMADLAQTSSTPSPTVLGMPGDAAFYRPELGRQLRPGEPGYEVGAAQIEAQRRNAAEAIPEYPMPATPMDAARMVGRAITEPDTLSRLGQGFNSGRLGYAGGVASLLGTGADLVGADDTAAALRLAGQQLGLEAAAGRTTAAGQIGAMGFDMAPAAVMLAASGGKTAGVRMAGQAVPLGIMGGAAAGQGIQDYRQTVIARGGTPNPLVEAAVGVGYGAAEMLFERFAIGKTGEAIRSIGDGIAQGVLRRDVAQVARVVLGVGESAGVNAGEEWATQVAQNLISKAYDPQRDLTEGATEAAVMGGLQGLAFSGGGIVGGVGQIIEQNQLAGLEERIQRGRGLALGPTSLADELMADITRGVNPDIGATPPPIPQGQPAPTRAQQIAAEAEARLKSRESGRTDSSRKSSNENGVAARQGDVPGAPGSSADASPRSGESAPSPASTRQEAASGPVLTGPSGAWEQSITAPPVPSDTERTENTDPVARNIVRALQRYFPMSDNEATRQLLAIEQDFGNTSAGAIRGFGGGILDRLEATKDGATVGVPEALAANDINPDAIWDRTQNHLAAASVAVEYLKAAGYDVRDAGQTAPRAENQSAPAPATPATPSPLSQENANALREEEGRQGREGLLSPPSEPNQSAAANAPVDYSNVATIRLRQMARKAGLDLKGSREEVIARLTSQAASSANSSASSPEATIATSSSSAAAGDRQTSLETPGPSLSAQQVSEPPSTSSASQSSTSRANQTLVPYPNDTRSRDQAVTPPAPTTSLPVQAKSPEVAARAQSHAKIEDLPALKLNTPEAAHELLRRLGVTRESLADKWWGIKDIDELARKIADYPVPTKTTQDPSNWSESHKSEDARASLREQIVREMGTMPVTHDETDIRLGNGGAMPANGVRAEKKAWIIIGGPGAGKSTIISKVLDANHAVYVSSDIAKRKLPEFESLGASGVHAESTVITTEFLQQQVDAGNNLVMERTGKGMSDLELDRLRKAGYSVNLVLVDLPRDESARRVLQRFSTTGRLVDPVYAFNAVGNKPLATYNEAIERGLVDGHAAYQSDAGKPRLFHGSEDVLGGSQKSVQPGAESVSANPPAGERAGRPAGSVGQDGRAEAEARPQQQGVSNAPANSERSGDQLPGNGERGDVRGEDPGLGGDADAMAPRGVDGRDAGAGAGQPGSQRGGDGGIEQPAAGASGVAEPQPRAEGTDAAGGGSDRGTAGIEDAARADEPVDLARAKAKADPNSIPVNSRNHVIEPGEEVAAKSNTAKFKANIEAIKLLRTLEREDRQATPDEKKVLARYTGWGWGGTIFDESKGEHAKKREQMREVMSEAEYAAARASITNAHYTAQNVVRPMWEMAKRLGFTGGRVLEPGAGIGNFLGMVPADVRDATEFVPVELDQLSGKMLKKLYPQADVRVEGFEETRLADNSFDLAIGNVPFSADVKPAGKDYRDLMLHDYFFARALDKVKPGGLVAMISTDGTLQKQADGKRVRGLFASKADLVGAIRLPNNAFEENAGTEVTTDILIFRKKDGRPFDGASFIQVRQLGTYDAADIRKTLERRASRLSERYNSDELSFEQYQRMQNDVEQQLAELDRHGDQLPLYVNEYFIDHPEMALGQHTLAGTMYRPGDYALTAKRGQDTIALLNAAIESLPADIMGKAVRVEDVSGRVQLEGTERIGSYIFRAGEGSEFFQVEQGTIKPADWLREKLSGNDWQEAIDETTRQKRIAIARSWMGVREAARKLHALEISTDATDRQLNAARRGLNEQYDAFVKEHGTLNHPTMESRNPAGFLMADPDFYLVQALEVQKQVPLDAKSTSRKTGKVVKGRKPTKREEELGYKMEWVKHPIFEKRQNQPTVQPTKADSVEDAVAISLGYHNRIDTGIIADLLGITEQEATKQVLASGLAFKDPKQGIVVPRATYLSGNVREKLREARESAAADAAYTTNVKALEAVQPPDVPVERIFMSLSSRFIPDDVTSAFASEFFGTEIETKYVRATNAFDVDLVGSPTAKLTDTFAIRYDGQEVMGGLDLLRHALDGTQPIARIYVGWGKDRKQITLKEETHKAQQLVKQMHDSFRSWAKTTKATVERAGEGRVPVPKAIENQYNEQFNGVIPVDYDGSYLKLPGLNNQVVRRLPHRMSVVARILADRCAVMAHGVGSGKTYSQIVAAMELRRLGLARKPMIVVHKSTVGDFARSFRSAYPGARLLVANEKTFAAKNRKRLMAQVALGDWDAVIVTQPQFELLQNDPARLVEYINGKVSELREALEAQKRSDGKRGGKTASQKRIEQQIKAYENKLKGLMDDLAKRTERGVYFQELGVDFLLVDEAHAYKNAPISTRKQGVKGIPSGFSMRALNTKIKALSVQEKRGDGTGVVFSTGTPITNTMAEAYVMLDLATPNVLREYNIHNFDEFADTFGATETTVEFTWSQQMKPITRFKRFENGQQLMSMIRAGFDVKMGNKELGLIVPEVEGGEGGQLMIVPSTPAYDQASEFLLDAASTFEELEPKERREASWVPISVMQAGMAAALDPRIINPEAEDDPRSKVNVTADLVSQWLEESNEIKGTVFVFADRFGPMDTTKLRGFVGGESFEEAGAALDQDVTIDADAEEDPETDAQKEEEKAAKKAEDKAYASGGFNLYKDLKAKLVARGVPAEQIAIINDYESGDAKQQLFDKMKAGVVRVLIGSTDRLGTGVNAQDRNVGAIHMDPPRSFTPAGREQRQGRYIRQGNLFATPTIDGKPNPHYIPGFKIKEVFLGMEKSGDTTAYQLLANKQKFIVQLLMGRSKLDSFDDPADEVLLSIQQQKALLTGDERVVRQADLVKEVQDLKMEKGAWENAVAERNRRLESLRSSINYARATGPRLEREAQRAENLANPKEVHVEGNKLLTDPEEIREALNKQVWKVLAERLGTKAELAPEKTFIMDGRPWMVKVTQETKGEAEEEKLENGGIITKIVDKVVRSFVVSEAYVKDGISVKAAQPATFFNGLRRMSEKLREQARRNQESLERTTKELAQLEAEPDPTFEKAEQLAKMEAELASIERALAETKNTANVKRTSHGLYRGQPFLLRGQEGKIRYVAEDKAGKLTDLRVTFQGRVHNVMSQHQDPLGFILEATKAWSDREMERKQHTPTVMRKGEAPSGRLTAVQARIRQYMGAAQSRMERRARERGATLFANPFLSPAFYADMADTALLAAMKALDLGITGGKKLAGVVQEIINTHRPELMERQEDVRRVAKKMLKVANGDPDAVERIAQVVREHPPRTKAGQRQAEKAAQEARGEAARSIVPEPDKPAVSLRRALLGQLRGEARAAARVQAQAAVEIRRSIVRAYKAGTRAERKRGMAKLQEQAKRLRMMGKVEARGAKEEGRAEVQRKVDEHEAFRQQAIDYAKTFPKEVRGAMVARLSKATTQRQLERAVRALQRELARYTTREDWRWIEKNVTERKLGKAAGMTESRRKFLMWARDQAHAAYEASKDPSTPLGRLQILAADAETYRNQIAMEIEAGRAWAKKTLGKRRLTAAKIAHAVATTAAGKNAPIDTKGELRDPVRSWLTRRWQGARDLRNAIAEIEGPDGNLERVLWDRLERGEEVFHSIVRDQQQALDEIVKRAGFKSTADAYDAMSGLSGGGVVNIIEATFSGKTVKIPLGDALGLIAHATDPQTLQLIADPDTNQMFQPELGKHIEGIYPTPADIDDLRKQIDPTGKYERMIGEMKQLFEKLTRDTQHVYRNLHGYEFVQVSGRWPRPRNIQHNSMTQELPESAGQAVYSFIENNGMYETRRQSTGVPILMRDPITTALDQIDQSAKMIGLAVPVRDAANVLLSRQMRETITTRFGKHYYEALKRQLMAISRATQQTDSFVGALNSAAAVKMLALNVGTWAYNVTSALRHLPYLGVKDWTAGLVGIPSVKMEDLFRSGYFHDRYHASASDRFSGVAPVGFGQTLSSGLTRDLNKAVRNMLAGDKTKAYANVRRAMGHFMGVMNAMDAVSGRHAWAAYTARAKRIKPGWSEEQRTRWVGLKARRLMRENQNGGSPLDMALDPTAARGSAASLFTLFTTDGFKTRNRIVRAYRKSKTFGTKVLATELVTWYLGYKIGSLAWAGITAAVAAALGWDDEDAERLAREVLNPTNDAWKAAQMLGGMLSPIMGQEMVDIVQAMARKDRRFGDTISTPTLQMVNAPAQALVSAVTRTVKWLEEDDANATKMLASWAEMMNQATAAFGINPFEPLLRRVFREVVRAADE